MKRQRFLALLLSAAILAAATASDVFSAERTPTWGWKEEEGASTPRKPRPAPAQNAWQAKTATPAPDPASPPNVEPPAKAAPAAEPPPTVKSYCENIADPALDARFLHQKAELKHLEEELAKKTTLLEAKKTEFQEWLKRRDDFINKAEGTLVKLYSKIKPDAAAPQLAALDEEAAAALLLKLSAKSSSAILDQMDTAKAARLVSVMIGAARPSDKPATSEKAIPRNASAEQPNGAPQEAGKPRDNGKS
jgi:flagellar motility protein MotE (MotC chaperone)